MSLIIHRCTACEHPDLFHNDTTDGNHESCSYGGCSARKHEFGPPEVIPSWSSDIKGRSELIEEIAEPGTGIQGYPRKTCDCTPCRELYDRLSFAA